MAVTRKLPLKQWILTCFATRTSTKTIYLFLSESYEFRIITNLWGLEFSSILLCSYRFCYIFSKKKYFQPSLTFFFWFNWLPHWNFFAENSIHANKSDGNIILREYSIITLPQNTQYLDPFPPYSHFVVTPPLKYSKLKFNNKSPAPPLPQLLKKKKKKKVNTTKKNAPWTFPEFTWIQIVLIIKDGFRIPLSMLNKFVRNIDWEILRYI